MAGFDGQAGHFRHADKDCRRRQFFAVFLPTGSGLPIQQDPRQANQAISTISLQ
jgi:hypothetical protein